MAKKELTCINCPMGCHLIVETDEENNVLSVSGNRCGRGLIYAKTEVKDPRRVVCSTVKLRNAKYPVVSCKTAQPIPKDKIFAVMAAINQLEAQAPVQIGDVLEKNIGGTGIDLVATARREEEL